MYGGSFVKLGVGIIFIKLQDIHFAVMLGVYFLS